MRRGILAVILLLALVVSVVGCDEEATTPSKLKVVTTTSLISSIVEDVGGDKVEVVSIVPPSQCPGHFDIKPSDVQMLADGDLFLKHGQEQFADELVSSANNPKLEVKIIDVKGNWMTPPTQLEAIEKIATALKEADSENKSYYEDNATKLKERVQAKEEELKDRLEAENVSEVKVLCAEWQKDFVEWAGFCIVDTYGYADELTPKKIQELIDEGKEQRVALVIDNLQSGKDAGVNIAGGIVVNGKRARHVVLSNFPGGIEGTETWSDSVEKNVDLLLSALEKY